eukprot:TRINITY_DN65674_c0_g1_i1.p1 TRINITY_DN65674_c0_g1~~TRINITY_DN65674_c0_g1_i1.p1  ORF type:complete len:558 (-),score=89.72 TRINITY_DN65674_c0_g1_i1:224-1897(-)
MSEADKEQNDELGQSTKEESPDETKPEEKDEMTNALEAFVDELAEDIGDKKRKKDKKRDRDGGDTADGDGSKKRKHIEVDISECPKRILIECTNRPKFDGVYNLMPGLNNRRPAYEQELNDNVAGAQKNYLYFAKKWALGPHLGEKKYVFHVEDVGLPHPCEPYPRVWKRYDKSTGGKVEVPVPSMRVIDGAFEEEMKEERELLRKLPSESGSGVRKPKTRSRYVAAASGAGDGAATDAAASSAAAGEQGDADAGAAKDKDSAKPDTPSGTVATSQNDSDGSSSSESGDEQPAQDDAADSGAEASDSSDDSSSSSASNSKPATTASTAAAAAAAVPAAPSRDAAAMVAGFEQKLRLTLGKLSGAAACKAKLQEFKGNLDKRPNFAQIGMLKDIITKLEAEYVRPQSRQPKAPPPAHLLNKKIDAPAGKEQKLEPPTVQQAAKQGVPLPHRTMAAPKKSKLRNHFAPKPLHPHMRVHYHGNNPHDNTSVVSAQHSVVSFRSFGPQLWFQQPGSTVVCDSCESVVSQAQGTLQGAPEKSQFAQDRFICCTCMSAAMNSC